MATLEKLRNKAGIFLAIVIGIALFSFVLGDFIKPGKSIFANSEHELAKIAGKSVPYQLYQGKVEEIYEINKLFSGKNSLDEQTSEGLREQVWQQLVRENVMDEEYSKLGLAIHPDELFDMVQGRNIHPMIQQLFGDPQTGQVNKAAVIQFLKNMDADPTGRQKTIWLYVENEIKTERIFTKYTNLIRKGLYVSNLEAKRSLTDKTSKVDFTYTSLPYSSIDDASVKYAQSDLEKYYDLHKQDFEQKASRDIEYVIFPTVPSDDDKKIAEEWINKAKPEFQTAADPEQYATLNSDTPFDGKNYKDGELPQEYNNWAFVAKEGDMIGPISDGNSFKLVRLASIKYMPDSVKARHILISPLAKTQEAVNKAKATADSLLAILKKGGNFEKIAKEFSSDPGSKDKGGDLGWFKDGMMVKPFNDACFNGKKGDIVIVETQFGYHIINVADKGKEVKKVQVAVLERKVTASSKTIQSIYSEASNFAGTNTTKELFTKAADSKKLSKRIASNLLENDKKIAGLDNPREIIRWAFKSKKGDVSNVYELGQNFVVATLSEIREEGFSPLAQVIEEVKLKVIREKKGELLSEKIQSAKKTSSSIETIAQSIGSKAEQAARVSYSSFSLPNAGVEPSVIAAAASASEGKVVGPITGNSGVYVLSVTAVNKEEGDPNLEKVRMVGSFASRAYYEAYEALKKNAEIKDNRSKFY
ncbi:MAG: peptidylprolyl isomerase [Bacteroidales bacterium]|nr:MAG: peptidylprolyl isomerase [Bacteroidales bacterium]